MIHSFIGYTSLLQPKKDNTMRHIYFTVNDPHTILLALEADTTLYCYAPCRHCIYTSALMIIINSIIL